MGGFLKPERGAPQTPEAGGAGRRGGGRDGEVTLAEHPDPSPRRGSPESLSKEDERVLLRGLIERWGLI